MCGGALWRCRGQDCTSAAQRALLTHQSSRVRRTQRCVKVPARMATRKMPACLAKISRCAGVACCPAPSPLPPSLINPS